MRRIAGIVAAITFATAVLGLAQDTPGWFHDRLWSQLVYNALDNPRSRPRSVHRIEDPTPDLYILRMGLDQTRDTFIDKEWTAYYREAYPHVISWITGIPLDRVLLSSRVVEGYDYTFATEPQEAGWITIRYEYPAAGEEWCGLAGLWSYRNSPDEVVFSDIAIDPSCQNNPETVFAHEIGHAMGLFHARTTAGSRLNYTMEPRDTSPDGAYPWFSAEERLHAQLLYQLPRGASYCGWPFNCYRPRPPTAFSAPREEQGPLERLTVIIN